MDNWERFFVFYKFPLPSTLLLPSLVTAVPASLSPNSYRYFQNLAVNMFHKRIPATSVFTRQWAKIVNLTHFERKPLHSPIDLTPWLRSWHHQIGKSLYSSSSTTSQSIKHDFLRKHKQNVSSDATNPVLIVHRMISCWHVDIHHQRSRRLLQSGHRSSHVFCKFSRSFQQIVPIPDGLRPLMPVLVKCGVLVALVMEFGTFHLVPAGEERR